MTVSLREHRDLLARAHAALETPSNLDDAVRTALIEDLAFAASQAATIDRGAVEVALIDSGDGTRFYVAESYTALARELAAWCRPRWDRTNDPRGPATLDDEEVINIYFAGDISEYFAIGTARLACDGSPPLEQGRYCVLSTTHLSVATSEWLERWSVGPPPPPLTIATTVYGWFVTTREPAAPTEPLPDDLLAAMRFGRLRGFDYLLFDSDAGWVEGLAVHDW